ncbi:hypothetical protein AB9F26_06005 [Falsihalocynthiibacter sp. BN13B15]|uniref:hypothetical protein n=1 Tax=Falsihalocynthiibacter sp. BN13B15 TaxID=3240871 RepID=UPI0035101D76
MKAALISTIFLFSANTAIAENKDIACEYGDQTFWGVVASQFDGEWVLEHHAGVVTSGGMAIPFPASSEVEHITLTSENSLGEGTVVLNHPEAPSPVNLEWVDEPNWFFDGHQSGIKLDPIPEPVLTTDYLEKLYGCKNDQMARLVGRATAEVNGQKMDFTFRLLVLDPETIYGVMHISGVSQGRAFNAWRSVFLER